MARSGETSVVNVPLKVADPVVYDILQHEMRRQYEGLELIASENFTSQAVMEACGSAFTNKYSEGLPGARYYGGNEYIDQLETLTQQRALAAFNLNPEVWGVNVQSYSGSTANFSAFTAVLEPNDRFMGLDLPSGGHLSHGFYRGHRKINCSSVYFTSLPYKVSASTGLIDYDALEETAALFSPKMIVAGGSAYPREWDYARMRSIADANDALLLTDMAHISGLVAAGAVDSPFNSSHIVTTTTHKSLRGPRAALIFYRKDKQLNLERRINSAVFPGCQGGPHNHAIAGVCVQLGEVVSPEFKSYAFQVVANARALAAKLINFGYSIVSGGTDNHLLLWDIRPQGLTGSKVEHLCDLVGITLNKNSVFGDASAMSPGGVRIGTPALTSRGLVESDFETIGEFLNQAVKMCLKIQDRAGCKGIKEFKAGVQAESKAVDALRETVKAFARSFPMKGFNGDDLQ
uniref:Serine hydroxymethyltransferase n=1 Tax=Spongospora subterranea TaxID=70186 RepID=A0A0H5R8W3_9EUKA|eukprot:CRZ10568.1 hypothetical protein [Spongospora subterranea]